MAAGAIPAAAAWPEYFPPQDDNAVPSLDADMSGYEWEDATPESVASDFAALSALVEHSSAVSVPEGPAAVPGATAGLPDPEWP